MMFRGRAYVAPQNPMMGHGRLGDTTTTTTAPGFVSGAELWQTPSAAFTAAQGLFTSPSTSFSGTNLAYSLGILAVPAALLLLVMTMGKGRR